MINSLISNEQNSFDSLCNWVIELLNETSKYYNISYGQLNFLLCLVIFIIITNFMIGSFISFKKKELGLKICKINALITLIISCIIFIGFGIVPLPDRMF